MGTSTTASLSNDLPAARARAAAGPAVAVDVTVRWGDSTLATRRVAGDAEAAVGNAPGSLAAIPLGCLGRDALVLARVRGGRATACVPEGCVGSWERRGGARLVAGPADVLLADGEAMTLWIDGFHIAVAATADGTLPWAAPPARQGRLGSLPYIALVAAAHALALGLGAQSALAAELEEDPGAPVEALRGYLAAAELHARAADPAQASDVGDGEGQAINDHAGNGDPGGGERAAGDEGAMGSRLSREAAPRRFALPGRAEREAALAAVDGLGEAQAFGMIGLLAAAHAHAPDAGFGAAEAFGPDDIAADGAMWARAIGDHGGADGLGLSGIGLGGGGDGAGVGLDRIGTVGHTHGPIGAGTGGNGGPGSIGLGLVGWSSSWCGCHQSHMSGRRGFSVRGHGGGERTEGRLPKEAIQRIVRQNFGRFRLCYEAGLARNPALEGRVSTRFRIGPRGEVQSAADAGSDIGDAEVVSCVVRAFYGVTFPEPPQGESVGVTYPIAFSPAE